MDKEDKLKEEKLDFKYGDFLSWLGGAVFLIIILAVAYGFIMHWLFQGDLTEQGSFGDQFGAINYLVSGVTLFMVVLGSLFQMRDLRQQTKSLNLQIKEFQDQKAEMARAAEAQEKANHLEDRAQSIQELEVELKLLEIDIQVKTTAGRRSPSEWGKRADEIISKLECLKSDGDHSTKTTE